MGEHPVAIATVEAIGILGWQSSELRILSLGCTTTPFNIDWGRKHSLGVFGWATKITDLFMTAQSVSAIGMTQHLLPDRSNLVRISPVVGKNRFELDRVSEIPSIRGIGDCEARKALPQLRPIFFTTPVEEDFVPYHVVSERSRGGRVAEQDIPPYERPSNGPVNRSGSGTPSQD